MMLITIEVGLLTIGDKDVFSLIWQSGFFAKLILLTLFFLSIMAWTITFYKTKEYRAILRGLKGLFEKDTRSGEAADVRELFFNDGKTAISRLYYRGERILKTALATQQQFSGDSHPAGASETERLFLVELKQRLENAAEEESTQLASGLTFLGTVITASPFLGLLGTVWGVMEAFLSIGISGSADLSTVAPGIAEALITTIAGLAVAIPAVFCHNYLNNRLKYIEDGLYRLSGELSIYFSKRWSHEKTKFKASLGN